MSEEKNIENKSKEVPVTEESSVKEESQEQVKQLDDVQTEEISIIDLEIPALLSHLSQLVEQDSIEEIKTKVEEVKTVFYKKLRVLFDETKQAFIQEGGEEAEFVFSFTYENEFKDLYAKYKSNRDAYRKAIVKAQKENLEKRLALIEDIAKLTNTEESLNKTFQTFREIQEAWKAVGPVAVTESKKLWENYHLEVAKFYDFIKINRELRDLDLKKNFEAKTELCEKAEALVLDTQIVKAFAKLQSLHDLWREIGPVQIELKDELWQRFKTATTKINKAHQDYFQNLKEQEKTNLEAKTALCEKVEELNQNEITSLKAWKKNTEEIQNIQKIWKTIGFAPQKQNNAIYERFCAACDVFFNNKREFFNSIREVEQANKDKKIDLCNQAEAMKDRTDWADATKDFIRIQKEWKTIGPVSQKDSNKLWNKFRNACDTFFNAKQKSFESLQTEFADNLVAKEALLAEIEKFEVTENAKESLEKLQAYQKQWSTIGRVPDSAKEKIQNSFKKIVQDKFSALEMPEAEKKDILFKLKVESMSQAKGGKQIVVEESKLSGKLKSLENEMILLENNIGFFAKSKNADKLIADMNNKIKNGKEQIKKIKEQLKLIRSVQSKN